MAADRRSAIAAAEVRSSPTVAGASRDALRRHPTAIAGGVVLLLMVLVAIFAPWLGTVDPQALSPIRRLSRRRREHWFGTDMLGRDVYSRVVYGARVSLTVGLAVAVLATVIGLAIGLVTGYLRWLDAVVMRVMDGLMSIPSVLLAIALMALTARQPARTSSSRSRSPRCRAWCAWCAALVLTLREQPYVEAAIAAGTRAAARSCCATSCPTRWRRCSCRRPTSAPRR